MRLAIGASRAQIARQLLIESLTLAIAGMLTGAGLAPILSRALIAAISTNQDRVFLSLPLDWRVLIFTASLALLTCIVFGLAPALQAAKTEPGAALKAGGLRLTAGQQLLFLRRGLVVFQVALSLLLVLGAVLFVRTFENLASLNVGFNPEHVLVAEFDATPLRVPVQRRQEFNREVLERVRGIAGVRAAARTMIVPLSGDNWNEFIDIPGTNLRRKLVNFNEVSSDYFRTLGVPMLAGEDFKPSDTLSSLPVAVVNQSFAEAFLGGLNAVGKTFGLRQDGGRPDKLFRVAGVAANTKYGNVREAFGPIVFVPYSQDAAPDPDSTILIRSDVDTSSLTAALRAIAAKNDPRIVLDFSMLKDSIGTTLRRERLMAQLSGFYGLLAVVLITVGLYGIMSYIVVCRTSEIGVRMALGASRTRILGVVAADAMAMLATGTALGLALAFAAGHAVQALLYDLKPTDPICLVIAVSGVAVVALAASLIPARRAANLNPIEALRAG